MHHHGPWRKSFQYDLSVAQGFHVAGVKTDVAVLDHRRELVGFGVVRGRGLAPSWGIGRTCKIKGKKMADSDVRIRLDLAPQGVFTPRG